MKTIIARFEDMKKDPAKALEDGISFNKVEEALRTLGISMRDTAGEFRPLQEVFTELGMQWESLTRNQQAYIATVAAGSRQQSRFLAMMNNFDRTLELIAESQNSAGAAARQYATYQDSIAAAQARLSASWEKFYSKIVDNDAIKFAINGLSSLVDALSKVPPAITAIGTAFGALSLQSLLQSKGGLIKIIGSLLGATDDSKQYEAYGLNAIQKFINGFQKGLNNSGIDDAIKEKLGPAISEGTAEAVKGLGNLAEGAKKTGSAFDILKGKVVGATTALWSLITNPVFLAIAAATAIVAALGYAIYKMSQKANDAAKEVKKLNKEIDDLNSQSKNQEDLINSYEELIRKTKRTEEEQKQLNSIIDQISETYKSANVYVDEYGNRHLTNVEVLKQENKQLDDNIKKLKLEALAAQEAFLATNSSQWTQENTTDAGLSSDFYSKWNTAVGSGAADAALQSIEAQLREQLPGTIQNGITERTVNALENIFTQYAPDFNIDDSKIKESIASLTDLEEIINVVRKEYIDAYKASENFGQAQLVIDQELQRINIDRWALNFEVDPKQSGLKAAFIDMLRALPVEQFKLVGDNLKKSFEESLQQLSEPKEILKAQNFIIDALKGSFEANKIFDEARKAGIRLSNEFLNNMQFTLKEREKELKENTIAAVSDIFGGIDVSNNSIFNQKDSITQKQAEKIVSQAEFIKNNSKYSDTLNNLYLEDLSPMMDKIDNAVEEAIKNGSTNGLRESAKIWEQEIAANKGIASPATTLFTRYVDQELHGVVDQIIIELENSLSNTKETLFHYKEFLNLDAGESLTDEQYSELQSIFGNLTLQYIEINKEGKEYLTIAGKTALLEKQREKSVEIIDKLYKANNEKIKEIIENENLTNDQKANQIQKIERQNDLLQKQKNTIEEIEDLNRSATAQINISIADKYYKDLEVIKQAQKEAQLMNGRINRDTYNSLLSIDSAYVNYVNKRMTGEGAIYEATAENLKNIEDLRTSSYQHEVDLEKESLQRKIDSLDSEIDYFESIINDEAYFQTETTKEANRKEYESNVTKLNDILKDEEEASNDTLENQQNEYNQALTGQSKFADEYLRQNFEMVDQAGAKWNDYVDALENNSHYDSDGHVIKPIKPKPITVEPVVEIKKVKTEDENLEEGEDDFNQEWAKKYLERAKKARDKLQAQLEQLDVLAPDFEIPSGSGGKELEKELEALTKAAEDLSEALEDLDKLLIDIHRDLDEVSVDYNPFTDLFEAWEKEWDYFYNIRRLMEQISTQAQYIDNLANAEYATADQRLNADHAKIGNILSSMSANDTYIEALRAGMSQTAVELMKDFGEYYKVDPTSGQIYQTDANLSDINALINQRQQEIYNLQKLQNEKENDLALENAKLDALEQEKSAYESILSTIESQYDSLKDNEDITVDLSQLGAEKEGLQVKIQASDASIDELKQTIRTMEDELQNIEVDITLKEQNESELENYVSRMEDKVQEYEEYWENLNNAIVEQQEHLAELQEMLNAYVDIAISTQQELYSAIVENYQDEINEKKKQYDYLKQLDNDYLNSLKDNINKQRQAREDANKQKSYQQNLQRAQLLQMDTSGAFRSELANVNKEIENQRQELYDDLVDKQVEALEKEIEKRHELYDKEVAALEERLAYMQENAILLWEMVNSIVAEGATAMMVTLENTTAYINADELTKANQRTTWEYNVKKTFEGVEQGYINSIQGLINIGNTFVTEKYPEIEDALDDYTEVFNQAIDSVNKYNSKLSDSFDYLNNSVLNATDAFQNILDSFMVTWNERTNEFTGYAKNWETITNSLKTQTENNLKQLQELYNEQGIAIEENIGSIRDYDEQLRIASEEMYNDFLAERERYRDELNGLIDSIRVQIEGAIKDAADAIRNAANNISATPTTPRGSGTPGSGKGGTGAGTISSGASGGGKGGYKGYTVWVNIPNYNLTGKDYTYQERATFNDATYEQLYSNYEKLINSIRRKYSSAATFWGFTPFKTGGIADFTGPAWLDGSKSQPERILSPRQTRLFESMVSSLEKASNNSTINSALGSSYNIGDINTNINVEKLDNETDIDKVARQVENRIMKSIRNRVSIAIA